MTDRKNSSNLETVFVIGAGVSKDFGYPLTRDLLFGLIGRLEPNLKRQFEKIVRFHHPNWNGLAPHLPDIEEFLTEVSANKDLLPALRPRGTFTPSQLTSTMDQLLLHIARWFHKCRKEKSDLQRQFKSEFLRKVRCTGQAAIISFNWDLEMDSALFGPEPRTMTAGYGLDEGPLHNFVLLKPHGSLNWFPKRTGKHIKASRSELLWKATKEWDSIYAFRKWREPKTEHNRLYIPWLVPPTHLKSFEHPMLKRIWARSVEALSTARHIYFIGYSMPSADWHSRYIFRCGFHNQVEGKPADSKNKSRRAKATGMAEVTVVNPDNSSFRRIEGVVGSKCTWVPKTLAEWLESDKS